MNEYGSFVPAEPCENIAQWDEWQHACLKNGDYAKETRMMDEQMTLFRVSEEKGKEQLAQGTLVLENGALKLGDCSFELDKIANLALIQKKIIVMTYEDTYYELRADRPRCLRKYLAAWNNHREAKEA